MLTPKRKAVKVHQALLNVHSGCSYLRHVLSRCLDSHRGAVTAGVAVHAAHHRRDGRLLPITGWRMCDVRTQEDDRLLEHGGPEAAEKYKRIVRI